MKKLGLIFLCISFSFVFIAGCSKNSNETQSPPIFKSSMPADNATEVSVLTTIEITFDEVVTLADGHGIKLNGDAVEVLVNFTKITLMAEIKKGLTYQVLIPVGAVINTFGVPIPEEIKFSFSTENTTVVNIDESLVVSNPSTEAINVYSFLKENYGIKSISAVQANVAWNLNEAEWVKQHTGKYPAMATFDYIHLPFSPANWIDYSVTDFVEEWWANNGLVSASWHWMVPVAEGATDYDYKSEKTAFKTSNVTVEGTWENTIVKADLKKMSDYLKLLQAKDIPVIWRPLHEAAGNIYEYANGEAWFWWGADGADAFKELWIFMFNYFEDQGLNNLIWEWTTQTSDNDFYPGDEYVDIIGRDMYNNMIVTSIEEEFNAIQKTYTSKMITLSELGNISTITDQWAAGARWAYFMPWYDYDRTNDTNNADFTSTDHEFANAAWWISAVNSDVVITRDELPNLK